MVLLLLEVKADLENLTNLAPDSDIMWHFKVKCTSCNESSDKESTMVAGEEYEMQGSKGKANLVQKCKFCGRTGTITIIPGRTRPLTAADSESGKYAPMLCLDCRGMEPATLILSSGWSAVGTDSNTRFPEVDLSDGEFVEYDEKASASVSIMNVEHKFTVTK